MIFFKKSSKSKPQTDAEYLAKYRALGNLEDLGFLYEKYMEMVFAVCYKYLGNEEESKDAVMQIFEHLVVKLRSQEVENFRSWLHSVSKNHCLMLLRTEKSKISKISSFEIMETDQDEHLFIEGFELDKHLGNLEDCLEKLNIEQKTCVDLFYYQEKCYQEIAEHSGYEISKVKSYIQNGKRNLKNCLEQKNE